MMDSEQTASLLADVKRTLKITWSNDNTDAELSGMIADAEIYLNHLLGGESDYSTAGMLHKLFLNYSLYAHNHCEDEFESAYLKDITKCQALVAVALKEAESEESESE